MDSGLAEKFQETPELTDPQPGDFVDHFGQRRRRFIGECGGDDSSSRRPRGPLWQATVG